MFGRLRRDGRHGEPVSFGRGAGLVSARARDENGRPLAGAEMVLRHKRTQRVTRATADDFGLVVTSAAIGTYAVSISAGGYRESAHNVEVVAGDHTALGEVPLQPDAGLRLPEPGEWVI